MVNSHQRVEVINYIEREISRQAAFAKRRNGLIKKAFEISMLCDVDVAFIAFSPTGCVNHFSSPHKRIEDVLIRFINLPSHMRQYPIENKESKDFDLKKIAVFCVDINMCMNQYLVQILNHLKQESEEAILNNPRSIHASRFSDIQQEINRVKEQIQRADTRLRGFYRNYQPNPETVFSPYETKARKRLLEITLGHLMERKSELLVDTNTSPSEQPSKEPEQLGLEATAKDGELMDESINAKDGGDSSPLKDPSPDQVNEAPQNESTKVKDSSQNEPITVKDPQIEPSTEKDPDSPAHAEPLIPYKPQAIKFNELLDQGKELKFAQTLQEVAPSCCRPTIINSTSTKTESVEFPVPGSNLPQSTEKLGTSLIDTPPPNSPMPVDLDPQDDALPSSEPVKDEEEEEHDSSSATVIEHNPDEDAIQSEPRRTSSPSFYISSFEPDTEIPGEETHGNVVPSMGLDNNDVYLNNNEDFNVPVSNMPRSSGFLLGSSSQHQTNNPTSYPMTAPPGFGTRDEGAPSLNPIVDQNFSQPEPDFIHTNRNPQPTIDLNRCFPLGGTNHNFMQTEPMMPPRPPGNHHHQFMQLLNQAAGSAVRPHWHMGVNMALQPQFGMLVPNHLSAPGASPFHHPQALMGNNNGSMLQNHYRGGSSNYYRRANMEPAVGQNPVEGSSNGRSKRKFNWGNGADSDEVNSFPPQQVPNTTHPEQQPINLFSPMNAFRSDTPSVYDPLYEGLGLPIDPHLRMFLASMESSKPWGPKQ